MTRAEEALFIGGALGKRETEPSADSWYARLSPLLTGDPIRDDIWGERREWGQRSEPFGAGVQPGLAVAATLPAWVNRPIGPEPRPPRPLAPSSAGEEHGADPPLPPGVAAEAAQRGVLIHKLLERLPDVAPEEREERARAWLERHVAELSSADRDDVLVKSLAVIDDPHWAELFGPSALAEVPLAATVGGQVIAGTADRLLVEAGRVLVADFKTARRPPTSLEEVPVSTLRQMAAYAAALAAIYPGRSIEAALLYTQTPQLIAIPADLLEAHKPAFAATEESLGG